MNMQRVSSVRVNANIIIIEKDVFSHLVTSVGQRKNSESPWNEESNVRPSESALWTIIDDKVCKLALRVIVLSTLDITSLSEAKKKHFNWLFLNKEWFAFIPRLFSWQAKYKSTNGFFFICRVNCGTPTNFFDNFKAS